MDLPERDGVEVIGAAAERIRDALGLVVEGRSDGDLAIVTGVLAEITLRVAADLDRPGRI